MRQNLLKILHTLERHIKTDIRYLAKGGFWSIGNFLITVGFGFAITVILANFVPKDILGTYQFILAIASILAVCTLSGMGTAIARGVARGKEGVFLYGAWEKFKWSGAIVALSTAISGYYFINDDTTLGIAFLIVAITTPFIESFKLYEEYLRGKEAFKEGVTLGFWRKPIPLLAVGIAAFVSDDLLILLSTYFLSHSFSYGIVFWQVNQIFKPGFEADSDTLKLSKHLSLVTIASQITGNLDKIFIWHFLGPVAVAGFTIGQITSRYAGGVFNTIPSIALPKISRQEFSTLQKTLPLKIMFFSIFMAAVALLYSALVPFIFDLIFPQYPESVVIAQILSILFVFTPSIVFTQALIAHNFLKAQYIITFISPVVFFVLLWALTPTYGVVGAAIAVVLVSVVVASLNYLFFVFSKPKKSL